ncbi:MAG: hypothetical protein QF890_04970 [Myxococcota bacterium]|nr:hypothetical protein [bacterium]MDP6073794.1 hypothetical protein [Myxococcota bacterium]MDP7073313.1 hypothetical protein [Myxococcota bacterium]MDP7297873.1 hypothetical protein [Myxococcota bacterium]MDP7431911.1 hypothetical protein [Myxococcota bacterium]
MKRDGSEPLIGGRARAANLWAVVLVATFSVLAGGVSAAERGADGRFEKRTSSHFVLFQDVDIDEVGGLRGSRRFEQQVLNELEVAYEQLDHFLGLRPPRRIEVWVYDPVVFDESFSGRFRFAAAGFFNGAIHIRGTTQMTVGLGRVLHHELVHAAFQAVAPSLVLPAWLNEGVAEWFEARTLSKRKLSVDERSALIRASRSGNWLPLSTLSASSFAGLGPRDASLAYLQSYGMVEFLARRFGERTLRELSESVIRSRDVERALHRTVRMGVVGVEERFRADLS